jgi:hypothetical protein
MYQVYGLAEATLAVTFPGQSAPSHRLCRPAVAQIQ